MNRMWNIVTLEITGENLFVNFLQAQFQAQELSMNIKECQVHWLTLDRKPSRKRRVLNEEKKLDDIEAWLAHTT
jgi:hypothetical protein